MSPAEIAVALALGFVLGSVLGLLGGGGGILAVPAFIHVLGMPVDEASTASLVVVAIGAAAGLIPHAIAGNVDWRVGATFGALGVVGSYLGGRLALLADDRLQIAGLIALIFLAASGMLRNADESTTTRMRHRVPADSPAVPGTPAPGTGVPEAQAPGSAVPGAAAPAIPSPGAAHEPDVAADVEARRVRWTSPRTIASATGVGLVTGFFGVGGGFVAVPALIWGAGLPVKKATATGLVVIIMNAAVALAARGPDYVPMPVTGVVALTATAGAVAGALLARRFSAAALKRTFGWLLVVIGIHEVWRFAQLY